MVIKCKMVLSYEAYTKTLEKQKQKDNNIEELKRSVAFLSDRFNSFLLCQPGNNDIVKYLIIVRREYFERYSNLKKECYIYPEN